MLIDRESYFNILVREGKSKIHAFIDGQMPQLTAHTISTEPAITLSSGHNCSNTSLNARLQQQPWGVVASDGSYEGI